MKYTLFTAFLFSVWWMNAADGQDRTTACCLKVTNTRIPPENIVNYTIQESTEVCPIRAVRFHTKKHKTICSDPDSKWAKKIMEIVDKRTTTKPFVEPITCFTSTTNMIATTTHKTSGTETETSTREIKSISTTTKANKVISDVDGKSSFTVITVQTTKDPENSGTTTIPEMDMRITTAAQIIEATPPLTAFKEPGLEVAASTKDCCLTVTENRPAFHEHVDYRVQETPAEDWDYIQNLNRRKTTEPTDKREFPIRKIKALEQDRVRSTETTDTLQMDGEEEKQTSVSLTSEINDPYTNNNEYFCLKKEPVQYFCIKQP